MIGRHRSMRRPEKEKAGCRAFAAAPGFTGALELLGPISNPIGGLGGIQSGREYVGGVVLRTERAVDRHIGRPE